MGCVVGREGRRSAELFDGRADGAHGTHISASGLKSRFLEDRETRKRKTKDHSHDRLVLSQ